MSSVFTRGPSESKVIILRELTQFHCHHHGTGNVLALELETKTTETGDLFKVTIKSFFINANGVISSLVI
jgi:hypothetical protein